MKYRLEISKSARKNLDRFEYKTRVRIITAFGAILADPLIGKPLEGNLKGLRSYRVGRYRILYEIHSKILVIVVVDFGHRRDVYE